MIFFLNEVSVVWFHPENKWSDFFGPLLMTGAFGPMKKPTVKNWEVLEVVATWASKQAFVQIAISFWADSMDLMGWIPSLKLTFSPLKMMVSKFGISKLPGGPPFSGANC